MAGIPLQGILHDLSKFSPVEFIESVKYYNGERSPIDICKEKNGYSMAWFNHRGRNKHHYEYWIDYLDKGGEPILMPYEYAVEMVCDWIGAGKAYQGKDWSFESQFKWWKNKQKTAKIHPVVAHFIDCTLGMMVHNNSYLHLDKKHTQKAYDLMLKLYNEGGLEEAFPYFKE